MFLRYEKVVNLRRLLSLVQNVGRKKKREMTGGGAEGKTDRPRQFRNGRLAMIFQEADKFQPPPITKRSPLSITDNFLAVA